MYHVPTPIPDPTRASVRRMQTHLLREAGMVQHAPLTRLIKEGESEEAVEVVGIATVTGAERETGGLSLLRLPRDVDCMMFWGGVWSRGGGYSLCT